MRQRREIEEGWRKQKEQEAEEQARAAEAVRGDEMKKWGCGVDAEASNTRMAASTPSEGERSMSKKNGGLLDWLGWDGKQKDKDTFDETNQLNPPMTMPSVRMTVPENDKSESLNPFSGSMSEAVSWLLTNEYSPIFLRGQIPRDVDQGGPSFYHALHHAHWPDFRAASTRDRFEDELRFRVPWCDAFEDLASLQHNDHMVDRYEPTRTSSAQWLNDMIKRGSLGDIMSRGLAGPRWSTEYARSVSPFNSGRQPQSVPSPVAPPLDSSEDVLDDEDEFDLDPVVSVFDFIRKIADLDDDGTDVLGNPKHWMGEISDSLIQAVFKDLKKPGVLEELRRIGFTSEDQVLRYLLGVGANGNPRHDFLMAPPEVVAAALRAAAASETEPGKQESIAEGSSQDMSLEELEEYQNKARLSKSLQKNAIPLPGQPSTSEEADQPLSLTSSSSSAFSWSRWGGEDENKDSIVSTMTTTERQTLPDGTVETKRVLKKRFADGREESNESMERQISHSSNPRSSVLKPLESGISSTVRQDKQTQTNVEEGRRPKRSGWFWRE